MAFGTAGEYYSGWRLRIELARSATQTIAYPYIGAVGFTAQLW